MFKVVIWHPFLEVRAKVKNFLRLFNLQHLNLDQKVDKYITKLHFELKYEVTKKDVLVLRSILC